MKLSLRTSTARRRRIPSALASSSALALLLAACGGGYSGPTVEAVEPGAAVPSATAADAAEERVFALWEPGHEAALLQEQRQLDPAADGSEVQLIVRLNPAAVQGGDRAAMASSAGHGEGGDAAALRASMLAAKVNAVSVAANAVLSRSVLQAVPHAAIKQQYSHAVEAFVVSVPWAQAAAVAAELARNPAVDAVEPDRSFSTGQTTAPVRTLDARAWGVDRIDQRARQFDNSFRQSLTGSGVSVYVVDTGVNPHNEFGTRLAAGFTAINDGQGTKDCNGHGTHVAGSAAGATLGVAPGARVVPVRVMNCTGSTSGSQVLAGLDWVAANGTKPGVVNMSLGGGASSTLDAAAQRLSNAGFSVVVAAGNSNVDACAQSPARAEGLVAVAASDINDVKASYSNWGSCVALWAPGSNIASAGRASTTAVVAMSGTSMAAPHVAGAAALLLQGAPTLSAALVRQRLLAQASPNTVTGAPATTTKSLLYAGVDNNTGITPVTPQPPLLTVVSVRSLTMGTQVPAPGLWAATAGVVVVNASGQPVAGAQVLGRFSNMTTPVRCTTASNGGCTLVSTPVPWASVSTLGVAVTNVGGASLAYTGGTRTAQVLRPAATSVSLSGLTGTMERSTPTAVNWTPLFAATLKNQGGVAVEGAAVQAVLQVYAGAQVVGVQTVSCRTAVTGQCQLRWTGPALNATHTGATLQVLGVSGTAMRYVPGAITQATVGRVR
jgi:hypothetical protein